MRGGRRFYGRRLCLAAHELRARIVAEGYEGAYYGHTEQRGAEAAYTAKQQRKRGFFQKRHGYAGAEQHGGGLAEAVGISHHIGAEHYQPADYHKAFFYYHGGKHGPDYPALGIEAD